MKKRSLLLAVICLLLTAMPVAKADVIFEPPDDFYEQHRDECEYMNRVYYANGDSGSVPVYTSPQVLREEIRLPNGAEMHITFTYEKSGEAYGLLQYTKDDNGMLVNSYGYDDPSGWVRLSDMLAKYDSRAFLEEYASEILDFTGTFNGKGASSIVLWSWPCSGEVLDVQDAASFTDGGWGIDQVFTDGEGREWGHIGYFYGLRNIWVCMSDPENESIPATITQTVSLKTPSPDGISALSQNAESSFPVLPVLLVVGVVIITALLIFRLSKKQGR